MDDNVWLVTIPGWQGSGLRHWQTCWEKGYPFSLRVEQQDWQRPDRETWAHAMDNTLRQLPGKAMLVAHSLGCLTVVHWAAQASMREQALIKGALLVAPPDLDNDHTRSVMPASGFLPLPQHCQPFPTHVVASSNDTYCSLAVAQSMAVAWGRHLPISGNKVISTNCPAWVIGRPDSGFCSG